MDFKFPGGTVFGALGKPRSWPPEGETHILVFNQSNQYVWVGATTAGRLFVNMQGHGFQRRIYFQPIVWLSGGAVLGCSWGGPSVTLEVNGVELKTECLDVFEIGTAGVATEEMPRLPALEVSLAPSPRHSYTDMLLIGTMSDMLARLTSDTKYDLVRLSGLLRHLLTDQLIANANRAHGLKIEFSVAPDPSKPPIDGGLLWDSLHSMTGAKTSKNIDAFLRRTVAWNNNEAISVRTVIDAVANARGGVHYGAPRAAHASVLAMDEMSHVDQAYSLRCISEIAYVTLVGLEPLAQRIQQLAAPLPDYSVDWVAFMSRSSSGDSP